MTRLWAVCVALAALALAAAVAEGASLRNLIKDQIQQQLSASETNGVYVSRRRRRRQAENPNAAATDGMICRAENKGKNEDRTCEKPEDGSKASEQVARCDECVQECHIFGDPHLKPFSNGCTTLVFAQMGRYNYLDVPGLKVDVEVGKRKGKHYVTKAWVDGKLALDADSFPSLQACASSDGYNNVRELKSDNGNSKDVTATIYVGCRKRNNVKQLEVLVSLADNGLPKSTKAGSRSDSSSEGAFYWANGKGACIDWVKYGVLNPPNPTTARMLKNTKWNCKRKSKLAAVDGRECTCAAECAAWGDPHVKDFARKSAGTVKSTFKMPPAQTLSSAERIMYSFQDRFAVFVELDACEFIVTAEVWMLKKDAQSAYANCEPGSGDPSFLERDNYHIIKVNAEDVCQDGTNHKARTVIRIPHPSDDAYGAQVYDDDANGYNIGRQAMLSSGALVPLDGTHDEEPTPMAQCLEGQGINEKGQLEVLMGGVQTVLKCHRRADNEYYFNICQNRGKMVQKDPSGRGSSAVGGAVETFLAVERAGRSSGWCASGDYLTRATTVQASTFEQRLPGQTEMFKFASNSNNQ